MSNLIKIAFLVVAAVIIAFVVRIVIVNASQHGPAKVNMQKVRVSAADLPQGLLLRDDDLRWQDTPVDKVPAGAVIEDMPGAIELKGALLRHPVIAGAVIVANDVILPNAPGFLAATLKPDMRAVSVAVDDVSGNAGLIEPGDYVDLLLTQQLDQKTSSPDRLVSSETVVEHVRVLASGSDISRPNPKSDNPDARQQRVRTVTLEVTPRMGEVVAVAARLGSLSLELRSFATVSRNGATGGLLPSTSDNVPRPPVWAGDVSRALRDLSTPQRVAAPTTLSAPPMPRTVAIYRGSQRSDASAGDGVSSGSPAGSGAMPPLPSTVSGPR
jgi:pilus assembly protein CpaB